MDKLVTKGKLETVTISDWASPCVLIHRKNKYRLVVDFKQTLDPKMQVNVYPITKTQDMFAKLAGARAFCVIDLADAVGVRF